jgi:regulatory protein
VGLVREAGGERARADPLGAAGREPRAAPAARRAACALAAARADLDREGPRAAPGRAGQGRAGRRRRRLPDRTLLKDSPPLARAKSVALRYLASRARTEAQVRSRLARAELAAEGDAVVAWLVRLGYLDDEAYAQGRARALVSPGRLGPLLAERRLVGAGVERGRARAAVAAALADGEGGGEVALCRELAERRARTADLDALDDRARRRLARFLLGRGFSGSAVARVLGLYEDM